MTDAQHTQHTPTPQAPQAPQASRAPQDRVAVERELRSMIAEAARLDEAFVAELPADTDLFGPRIGLTSLAGVTLLGTIDQRFGVDVAALDLSLDSLQSIATLSDFVTTHLQSH